MTLNIINLISTMIIKKKKLFEPQELQNKQAIENKMLIMEEFKQQQPQQQVSETLFSDFDLAKQLVTALTRLGYTHATKAQKQTLVHSLKGRDILCLSETGSGKTLAFLLPIIEHLVRQKYHTPYSVLIVAPTRELCIQIKDYFDRFQGVGIGGWGSTLLYGGIDAMKQVLELSKKPAVIVGTPGRILQHLQTTKGFNFSKLKYLIFDEADRLLNMDFEKQINEILSLMPKQRITYLYSATLTQKVGKLQRVSLRDAVKVQCSVKFKTVNTLKQFYIFIPSKWKDCYLIYLLLKEKSKKTIVFVKTCLGALRISLILKQLKFKASCLHGDMSQIRRQQVLNEFKQDKIPILVCTDVASRGIDIHNVNLVLNYDLCGAKNYVHRVGRTARLGMSGTAISIVTQYDVQNIQTIQNKIGKKMQEYPTVQKQALLFLEKLQSCHQEVSKKMKNKQFQ